MCQAIKVRRDDTPFREMRGIQVLVDYLGDALLESNRSNLH
jgi:hypothetical protein